MMKNFRNILLVIACLLSTPILALEGMLQFRSAAFFPAEQKFKNIYGRTAAVIEGELGFRFCRWFQAWINVDFLAPKGRSLGFCKPTRLSVITTSFGINFPFDFWCDRMTFYTGLGGSFAHLDLKNTLVCGGCQRCTKGSTGFVVKSGLNSAVCERVTLGFFVDYTYQPVPFCPRVDVGGVRVGGALGMKF